MVDNLCNGMNDKFKTELNKIRKNKSLINNNVSKLKDKMNVLNNIDLTDVNDVRDGINNARIESAHKMNKIEDSISSLTGSCLDGVFNELNNIMNNLNNFIDELLPKNVPELDILSGLGILKGLLDKLGISDLISKLDELLGCLSDSDCIPIDETDDYFNEINTFVDSNGLTDEGGFDQDSFLEKMDMSDKVKNGLNTFKSDMSDLSNEVKDLTGSTASNVQEASQPKVDVSNKLF